jgi:hypothetical protein
MDPKRLQLAVVGAATCDDELRRLAQNTGREIARAGATLLCGGRGGVMAAAAAGADAEGGQTVGILPGACSAETLPNPHLQVEIYTGMGQARNQILVLSADAVIAIGGGWGTLSEIALALKQARPVVLLESWTLDRPDGGDEPLLLRAKTAAGAVHLACSVVRRDIATEKPR